MRLVEQHRIRRGDPRFAAIDQAAFASKNLYNQALYVTRQAFIHQQRVIAYAELARELKTIEAYRALPRKVSQWVLKQVALAWQSYFAACAAWKADPSRFLGHPRLPRYLDKQHGRNLLVYTTQALSQPGLRAGRIELSGLSIVVQTKQTRIAQVRVVPHPRLHPTHYTVEVIYEREPEPVAELNPTWMAGIDLGVNNLAALASNKPGFIPVLVNGRPLKAINQGYNQRRAHLQAQLPADQHTSRYLDQMADKRHRRIQHHLHVSSRRLIDLLVCERIGTLIIGKNDGWKQQVRLGKRSNQNFVFLPHARFIQLLTYKAALVGIRVILTEEAHTSKCSFLDLEPVGHHDRYLGRRVKRGLFRASTGQRLNADVNGAYNMLRKVVPDSFFGQGIAAVIVRPIRLAVYTHH